ncbi:MAG: glutamine synthetase III [Erysipelotrichaceae bacterium]
MLKNYPFAGFGENVFNEKMMLERLPHPIFKKWLNAYHNEGALDKASADAIAHAMKEWALEKGVTHFSHYFHPMHGTTAEKHVSFIDFGLNNEPIARFNGKALIKGEGDASSFPSGGLRATFEARGYTYWDLTSPAFVLDNTLHIPTVFVSYNGETLDKKAPLLKSMQTLSTEATRICNILKDKDVKRVTTMIGLEQEYFLIDKSLYEKRYDLMHTGRTLFGVLPPKSQEFNDHYYGNIPARVRAFMAELNQELWKLGIYAKAEHNEVAPCQFEIAPIYCDANLATDQNQIMMSLLKTVADRHHLACLLHEKPFIGVNGSGKHNNFSLVSDDGQNLYEPGEKPHENIRFLLMVCATIQAVDRFAPMLRMSSSTVNNDYRLGASEAPPAIISICMGSYLEEILLNLRDGKNMDPTFSDSNISISSLAYVPKDTSDRNRTSPFAFTGNKFEFRMLGSSRSSAPTNTILNTILADSMREIADELEGLKYIQDIRDRALLICQRIIKDHSRILFSGDGYHESWIEEAKKRGLANIPKFVDSIDALIAPESVALFKRHNIFTENELNARVINNYVQYNKQVTLEARSLHYISERLIMPAILQEIQALLAVTNNKYTSKVMDDKLATFYALYDAFHEACSTLADAMADAKKIGDARERAFFISDHFLPLFDKLRTIHNRYEAHSSHALYPLPDLDAMFTSLA